MHGIHDTPAVLFAARITVPSTALSKEEWEKFVAYCDAAVAEHAHLPRTHGFDSDDEGDLPNDPSGQTSRGTRALWFRVSLCRLTAVACDHPCAQPVLCAAAIG